MQEISGTFGRGGLSHHKISWSDCASRRGFSHMLRFGVGPQTRNYFTNHGILGHVLRVFDVTISLGGALPVVFGICFFLYVGLTETLRHGVFGLSQQEIATTSYAVLAFCALIILRTDAIFVLRRPNGSLYGEPRLVWSWTRSLLGLLMAPMLLIVPVVFGASLIQIKFDAATLGFLGDTLLFQTFVVALSVELFFREAALKAFGGNFGALLVASALASFVHALPLGGADALIACGLGIWMLALRLFGMNILGVALVHGVMTVVLAKILVPAVAGPEIWTYAISFTVVAVGLFLTVVSLFAPRNKEMQYA